ncbi:hypothetical protein ACIA5H_11455 [Nocardia sp. NPDC051900]|uniref:hypothetical protein n=1 Tax=Nocardia sp. NPDC051900 TaxID=3364326 RepID=UPI0037A16B2D
MQGPGRVREAGLGTGDLLATGTSSGVGYARTPAWLVQPGYTAKAWATTSAPSGAHAYGAQDEVDARHDSTRHLGRGSPAQRAGR